jgi:hypothetical protein
VAGIDPKFYYLTLGLLALCTLVGLVVAYRLQREVNEDLVPPSERELLGPLEKAYYSGLMREEEFQRIQESMARHMEGEAPLSSKSPKPRVRPPTVVEAAPSLESAMRSEAETGEEHVWGEDSGGGAPPPIIPPDDSSPDHAPG